MSDSVYQGYPAWRYHATLPATMVPDEAADQALGKGWFDSPTKVHAPPVAAQVPATPPPEPTQLPAEDLPGLEVPTDPDPDPDPEPEAPKRRRASPKT